MKIFFKGNNFDKKIRERNILGFLKYTAFD